MILFELYGRPGAGKSTLAYYLTYRLKRAGVRTEFVGEAAREHIYDSAPGTVAPPLIDNQALLSGQQFERVMRLKRHGFQAVVSDSPVIQGLLYSRHLPYYDELFELVRALEKDLNKNLEIFKILIRPTPGSYDPESRVQRTEEEAQALEPAVLELSGGDFWRITSWDNFETLGNAVVDLSVEKLNIKALY